LDKKIEIQLGSTENVNTVNVDNYDNIILKNVENEILEYDINNILSVTAVFEAERQNTQIYRIYGGLEYMSMLNGLWKNYTNVENFFTPNYKPEGEGGGFKTLEDSFDFYLVRPTTGYTKIANDDVTYIRQFEVVATPSDFELLNAGFSNNVYGEQKYSFVFNKDFDVSEWFDEFGFPIMELYLYPLYSNLSQNGNGDFEQIFRTVWSTTDGTASKQQFTPTSLAVGDMVYGDKIEYSASTFEQTQVEPQTYYIRTYCYYQTISASLRWKYNAFIPFRLRYFSNELSRENTGSTSYDATIQIPSYATDLGDGNFIWREILEQGYIDPLTGIGVDYPFVNKRRYLFDNVIFDVIPDLTDLNTIFVFSEIRFDDPSLINSSPLGDLDDIGKPCQ
jgi:hypothetical protein